MSAYLKRAFALANERAKLMYPHGTDADALADVLRQALADVQREQPTRTSLLHRFIEWSDLANDGDQGADYLNGDTESRSGKDGWADLQQIVEEARALLTEEITA